MIRLSSDRVYVIAEAGPNHNGDPAIAQTLIDVAAEAGADAVKFQLFVLDEIVSPTTPLAEYQKRSGEINQREMLQRLLLSHDVFRQLKAHAERRGLDFLVTPFDAASAKFLASLGVKAMKIGSGEITNLPFLQTIAALKIFTIISTGMSTLEEVEDAIAPFQEAGTPYALLHCVSAYPAPVDQINMRAMETLRTHFRVPVGYSDHTLGLDVAVTAAALGAQILEKHFTLDRTMVGPDHAASVEPDELQKMIRIIRDKEALRRAPLVQEAIGTGEKRCQPCEEDTRAAARRSVVVVRDIARHATLTEDMIAIKRPGTGIPPKLLANVLGKKAAKDLQAGTVLTAELLLT